LALPLAACLTSSVSLFDLGVWGTVSLLLQLFLFRMTDMLLPDLPKRITQDDMAAAVVLSAFKLSGSILLASAVFVKF